MKIVNMPERKMDSVTIISFRMTERHKTLGGHIIHCYGLGDDNKMYYWNYDDGEWYQFWSPNSVTIGKYHD